MANGCYCMHRSGDLGDDLVFSLGSGRRSPPPHDFYRLLVCQKIRFSLFVLR